MCQHQPSYPEAPCPETRATDRAGAMKPAGCPRPSEPGISSGDEPWAASLLLDRSCYHDGARAKPAATAVAARRTAATFPGRLEELRRMRAGLRRELNGCPVADEVILCASELAPNAVLHSDTRHRDGTFTSRARLGPCEYVLIELEDDR